MNLYRRLHNSKFWYTPIYYVLMGVVVHSVWTESGSHWGIPHIVWQAGCVSIVVAAVLDSFRYVTTGSPQPHPESNV